MYPKRLILDDARQFGIAVLSLDVNLSDAAYRVERVGVLDEPPPAVLDQVGSPAAAPVGAHDLLQGRLLQDDPVRRGGRRRLADGTARCPRRGQRPAQRPVGPAAARRPRLRHPDRAGRRQGHLRRRGRADRRRPALRQPVGLLAPRAGVPAGGRAAGGRRAPSTPCTGSARRCRCAGAARSPGATCSCRSPSSTAGAGPPPRRPGGRRPAGRGPAGRGPAGRHAAAALGHRAGGEHGRPVAALDDVRAGPRGSRRPPPSPTRSTSSSRSTSATRRSRPPRAGCPR
jgi:hypothetical protein